MCYHNKIKEVQSNLFSFVKSKVYSFHDAQDIVQNVNIILINKKDDYDENKNFKNWALRIAEFQMKAYFTLAKRSKVVNSSMGDEEVLLLQQREALNLLNSNCPSHIFQKKESQKKLNNKIKLGKKSLSKNQLNIINLSFEGLNQKQIAKTLNMNLSTVSVTKSRAVRKMKDIIYN